MVTVAFVMWSRDNDSIMFDSRDQSIERCPKCRFVLNRDYIRPTFKLRKKKFDLSVTYDHIHIASREFKDFCLDQGYERVEFVNLPNNDSHFVIRSRNLIAVDKGQIHTCLRGFMPRVQ